MEKTYIDYSAEGIQQAFTKSRFHNAKVTAVSGGNVTVIVTDGDAVLDHVRCDFIMKRMGFVLVSHKDSSSELPSKWLFTSERVYRRA